MNHFSDEEISHNFLFLFQIEINIIIHSVYLFLMINAATVSNDKVFHPYSCQFHKVVQTTFVFFQCRHWFAPVLLTCCNSFECINWSGHEYEGCWITCCVKWRFINSIYYYTLANSKMSCHCSTLSWGPVQTTSSHALFNTSAARQSKQIG